MIIVVFFSLSFQMRVSSLQYFNERQTMLIMSIRFWLSPAKEGGGYLVTHNNLHSINYKFYIISIIILTKNTNKTPFEDYSEIKTLILNRTQIWQEQSDKKESTNLNCLKFCKRKNQTCNCQIRSFWCSSCWRAILSVLFYSSVFSSLTHHFGW